MRALVELPASMRQIRLSGGKDSRLLASLALLEGMQDEFEFMTFGLPGSGETEVSEMVAKRFGLNWTFQDRSDWQVDELDRTILTHVFQMSGVRSAWDMKGAIDAGDSLTLSGNMSEFFRIGPAAWATRNAVTRSEAWDALIAGQNFDRMNLLRKDQREVFIERIYQWMTDLIQRGETLDRISSHMFPEFIARWQYGAGTEANGKLWSFPFLYADRRARHPAARAAGPGQPPVPLRNHAACPRGHGAHTLLQGSLARACLFASAERR